MYVRQILKSKGSDVWSTRPDATVLEALEVMAEKDVGALLVLEEGKLVGIFSERDYARKVYLAGKSSADTLVRDVMTPKVLYIGLEQEAEDCLALMTHKHVRHLAVMENEQLVGVISIGDVVKALIDKKEFIIQQLERYITGSER
jgi:IMP dehydrogenase